MKTLAKLIKTLFNPQPSDATNQQWRLEIQPLVDEHQAERRAWYKEKRELKRELTQALEREASARRAMDNTQALMTPHLTGKTRVQSVDNHRMQLDVPTISSIDPYRLLAGFAHLLAEADLPLVAERWPASVVELEALTPPLYNNSFGINAEGGVRVSRAEPEVLPLDRIADLQRTPLPRIHSISPE